ncbi:SDR family oxidoreductase [Kangiella geojedonensis]|uniref:Malonic semialdehyde reductase n=1 Tax=Kangiella geojedonensis TaxID=914150 RepID=A0A0F6TP19_9GAMM|nr:SDR family oxidoreductase [Kangiella geojedonensis]AKE51157.1 malonic semialdehyde reductase [Kangiella geojedonensis]
MTTTSMSKKVKTVMVTGASSGFGLATARRFAEKGHRVIVAARRKERLESLKQELDDEFGADTVFVMPLDVTSETQIEEMLGSLPEEFAEVDVLVNNAGLALGLEPAHEANLDDWHRMVDTNIKGLYLMTRKILPGMVERRHGHIINIGSIAGNYAYPGGNAYGATKAFVKQFTRNLRADLLGTQIRVTNIEPGLAETEFSLVRFNGDQGKADDVYKGTDPLTAGDIAEAVIWAAEQPQHVNINSIELMPTSQAWAALAIDKIQG